MLFTTEMWERFNFYGMRAFLTLFIVNGLMMSKEDSSLIYGGFLGLCYLTPMLGGFISDRYLGNRNCIMLGGSLMAIGQFLLFFSASMFDTNLDLAKILMYSALLVLIFGNGFFKPNISSMVGSLYPKQEKTKLDTAFTIFYMGINIGAFLGQFICPMVGDHVDANGVRDVYVFKWGFLAAGIAMILGTVTRAAKAAFLRAKDLDLLRFRISEEFQADLRDLCARSGTPVARVDSAFEAASPGGIVGNELILEHLHLTIGGYFLMGKTWCDAMREHSIAIPPEAWRDAHSPADSELWAESTASEFHTRLGRISVERHTRRWPFSGDTSAPPYLPRTEPERIVWSYIQGKIQWPQARYRLSDYYAASL